MQQTVLDNLNTAVITLNQQFQVLYLNPAAELMLDISLKRIQNQSITDWFDQGSFQADLDRALGNGRQYTRRETSIRLYDETIMVDYSITPVQGSCIVVELSQRDRLQRITREESLLAKQETSKSMIRGLAHEIKNPLGGIRGAAQLLSRELPEPELQDFTEVIIQEADRLRDLVDRMLGPLKPPEMLPLNIHQILDRAVQLISAETRSMLTITKDYDPSIPEIPGDAERLIQAMLNIVRNGMQAIEGAMAFSDGSLTVRTRITRQFTIGAQRPGQVCHISVIDNGPGIPSELAESIFYPMISGRAEGTGLGLPLSQSIISQHQGLIECDSKPGCTVFHIYLPLAQNPDASPKGTFKNSNRSSP